MAFNAQKSVDNILNLKGDWERSDEEERNRIQERAKKHYNDLIGNGYGAVAEKLQNSNYTQAQDVANRFKTSGMSKARNYITDKLIGNYNISPEQANKALEYNDVTGDMQLGGVSIGRGDAMVDGTNYVTDPSKFDSTINKYAQDHGLQKDVGLMYNQGQQQMQDKTNELWGLRKDGYNTMRGYTDDYMGKVYGNPFETDTGKSILNYYAQAGEKAGYNQIASGAGSNGGNIDSYSVANAVRQNAALRSQGEQAAIAAYNNMMNSALNGINSFTSNANTFYNGMSDTINQQYAQNQQLFDNDQTAKNNHVDNLVKQAGVTGYTPGEWLYANNPYFNADGTLKEEYKDFDFKAAINNAVASGNTEQANLLRVARGAKIAGDREHYEQYDDGDWLAPMPERTATMVDNAASRASAEKMNADNNRTDVTTAQIAADTALGKQRLENQGALDQIDKTADVNIRLAQNGIGNASATPSYSNAVSAMKNGTISQPIIDAVNRQLGTSYTLQNPPPEYTAAKTKAATVDSNVIQDYVDYFNAAAKNEFGVSNDVISNNGVNSYTVAPQAQEMVARRLLDDNSLTDEQVERLLNLFHIDSDIINRVKNEPHYNR